MDWEIGNYAFGAAAGHPFLRAVIENCVRAQKDVNWAHTMLNSVPRVFREELFVLCTTGPLLVSRTLAEFPDAAKHVKVLFPDNVCDTTHWNRFGTYGINLMQGGWRKRKGHVFKRLIRLWRFVVMRKMMKKSERIGRSRAL
jgi:hypothetical protein